MRVSEIERLKKLRAKQATGAALSEKEVERLESLSEIERREIEKNGRGEQLGPNSGGGNLGESREGRSDRNGLERGKQNQHAADVAGDRRTSNGAGGELGNGDHKDRGDRGNIGGPDDSNGSDRGPLECEEYGGDRGDQGEQSDRGRSSEREQAETIIPRKVDVLAPKKEIKPRKKKEPAAAAGNPIVNSDMDFIAIVLQSGFGMIAAVTARPHWEISEGEAKSVSDPLTKMFNALDKAKKKQLEKYINPIMLGSAVAGIVVPRLMVDMAIAKEAKRYGKQGQAQGISGTIAHYNGNADNEARGEAASTGDLATAGSDVSAILAGLGQ